MSQRIGVHFSNLSPAVQAVLDRFIFHRMREQIRLHRHVRGLYESRGGERRGAHRVPTREIRVVADGRVPSLEDQARIMAGIPGGESHELCDLSSTGCAFEVHDATFRTGQLLTLTLTGAELELELTGEVVYVVELEP